MDLQPVAGPKVTDQMGASVFRNVMETSGVPAYPLDRNDGPGPGPNPPMNLSQMRMRDVEDEDEI